MEENGAAVARRLLATLEGGTVLLAILALLLHAFTNYIKLFKRTVIVKHTDTYPERILISNTNVSLGKAVKDRLESKGCTVISPSVAAENVNVLIIIGSEVRNTGLDGLSDVVTHDVYNNLKLLESLVSHVRAGGRVAWISCGANCGPFAAATDAFDKLIRTQLELIAKRSMCVPVWLGRHAAASSAVDSVISSLIPSS